jgi:DNA helicase-2/ATP-dependent DNA helicase PcrA
MNYLDELNSAQREAVIHTDGPSMVIAGAGSGKTRVLTYRIAHLVNQGVDPFSILSLTFTNKAAREMKERISKIIGDHEGRNLWMGTFHSVFAKILRFEATHLGYESNFTIYDTADTKSLLKTIIREQSLDDKVYKVGSVYSRISSAKNNLISPQAYKDNPEYISEDKMAGRPRTSDIYALYAKRCKGSNAMDFDDLLFNTNILFRDHIGILQKYQHRFKYLLVDEYQDTNYSQYLIVKKLAALNENICVVGDDAQSIYSFRGANIANILNFRKDYPDYKLYKLEQNYRSTKTIVEAANSVIEKNKDQIKKNVWTDNEEGDPIKVMRALSDNQEGQMVANSVFETRTNNQAQNVDFAVLYRTNAQSRSLEEALRKTDIPYRIYGGLSFYQRKEIRDLLGYFRMVVNPNDEEALKRIINYPARGVGKTTIERLIIAASEHGTSIWNVINRINDFNVQINGPTRTKLSNFVTMIRSFQAEKDKKNAFDLGKHIASSTGILKDLYADKSPEGVSRHENVEELLNGMREFVDSAAQDNPDSLRTMPDFLSDVALLTDADSDNEENKDTVSLMTIHASKGLEFPYVYIVGMEENLFPSQLSISSRAELEEERRLFYVAITRAKTNATLSFADTRYKWGQPTTCEPSRFLEEIDPKFLEHSASTNGPRHYARKQAPAASQASSEPATRSTSTTTPAPKSYSKRNLRPMAKSDTANSQPFASDDTGNLSIGMQVEHQRFGKGKVLKVEEGKATVFFPAVGQKQLLLKFAKLKILN